MSRGHSKSFSTVNITGWASLQWSKYAVDGFLAQPQEHYYNCSPTSIEYVIHILLDSDNYYKEWNYRGMLYPNLSLGFSLALDGWFKPGAISYSLRNFGYRSLSRSFFMIFDQRKALINECISILSM